MPAIHQIISDIHTQLTSYYPEQEIDSLIRILFRYYYNMSPVDMHLRANEEIPDGNILHIQVAVDELKKYRPIQYIIGETEFYGLKFMVTPDVLIPRPETEELVDWIVHEYKTHTFSDRESRPKILDIGTGSGCIAISLAASLPFSEVWAMDISKQALTIARTNTGNNNVQVHVIEGDILSDNADRLFPETFFDIIVSNPPYISLPEKSSMHSNVLEYEPHQALFAPGDDPLLFYRHIAQFGLKKLQTPGRIFLETNEAFSNETATILEQYGYTDITPRKDINGKWRMISAKY